MHLRRMLADEIDSRPPTMFRALRVLIVQAEAPATIVAWANADRVDHGSTRGKDGAAQVTAPNGGFGAGA
jgi:hypothetical protein